MSEKRFNSRIIHKHDTETNWLKSSFIPLRGELVIYDVDDNYDYERIKVGDGVQNVNDLPFINDALRTELLEQIGVAATNNQSDWNVNDETSSGYVKNKPFYDSRESVELFNGKATSIYGAALPNHTYNVDNKYIVVFDGTEYELSFQKTTKPTQLAGGDYYYLGSPAYFNGTPYVTSDKEYPFCITTFSDSLEDVKLMVITKANQKFPVDVQVIEKSGELKQIDAKYLPNGATTQSDWSINDQNASGYVKNRTHYVVDRELLASFVMSAANVNSYSVDDADSSDVIRSYINGGNSTIDVFIDSVLYQCQAIFNDGHYYINLDGSTNTEQGLRIYIGGSKPNMIYLHPESFGLDMSANTRMVEIYTPEVLKQLDPKYIKDMYYETEPAETVLVDNLTSDTSDDNWPSCNFITGDKYKVIWNGVAYDCVCHNYDGWKVLGTPGNYPFYIDDDGGDALYVSGANEEDTWVVSIIHVKQEINQIAPKYIKEMYYEEENILTSGTINEPGFLNDSYNLTALTSSFIEGAEYIVRINGIERTVVCKFDDDGSGNQFLYLGAYPPLMTEESWFSVVLHVASNNLMAYVHDRIPCPATIEVLQRPIHPIGIKYLPIIGHGVGTVFEGTYCNGEYRDEKYKTLFGEHTLVIDGVATTVNFIDAVGGSYASCDFGDIETWNGAICIALQDDGFHDIKIIGPRQVIKKEYLPEISSEQSDWEQNDESHSSYIKNRPFYTEIQTIFDNLDVTGNLTVPHLLENELTLKEGASYRVDGVFSYNRRDELINVKFNGIYKCTNGEISIFPYEASGEPVLIVRPDHIYLGLGNKYNDVSVTFYTLDEVTKYHKIDANYLPDNLATIEYVDSKNVQPDWNQMDSTAADYVKNRTHWDESFILDVSDSDKAYDFDSGFGFLRVSTNPDDLPDDIDGLIIEYDDVAYSNATCNSWPAYNATVYSIKIDNTECSMAVIIRQENTSVSVYKRGTRYSMTNPGVGVWVIYDPGVSSSANAKIYTNNVHSLDERYIPNTIARTSQVDARMNKTNPVGTGSLSMNRKSGSSEGISSTTLGYNGSASGQYALAEGAVTSASGYASHAEGYNTSATRHAQHVEGQFNILDTEGTTKGKYIHIVGNGTALDARSNAHTIDWNGLGWFKGGVKIGGVGQDDNAAKEVATTEYVDAIINRYRPKITTVTMSAANWTGDTNPWSQVVNVNGVTVNSKVDLQPTAVQIVALQDAEITLMLQNDNGVISAWAIGNKPTEDYTMDVQITEVIRL